MKRKVFVFLIAVLMVISSACSSENAFQPKESISEDTLSQICMIESSDYASFRELLEQNNIFTDSNAISGNTVTTYELPTDATATFQTDIRNYNLRYTRTIFYPAEAGKVHIYRIEGTENGRVGLKEDGSVYFIAYPPSVQLSFANNASPETVQAALEPAFSDLIDFSDYERIEVSDYDTGSGPFLAYDFNLLHEVQGYVVDYAMIRVTDDGTVVRLSMLTGPQNADEICDRIDKDLEEELILAKLKSIYDTDASEYLSHTIMDNSVFGRHLTTYNDEICVRYVIDCRVNVFERDTERSLLTQLLIPVSLLYSTESAAITE